MTSSRRSFFVWVMGAATAVILVGGFEMAQSVDSGRRSLRSEHAQATDDVPPGQMVVVAEDGKLFHLAGCTFIHDKTRSRTIAAREASLEGYTPCVRCLGHYLRTALISRADHAKESREYPTLK